jgi:hypothetical protein
MAPVREHDCLLNCAYNTLIFLNMRPGKNKLVHGITHLMYNSLEKTTLFFFVNMLAIQSQVVCLICDILKYFICISSALYYLCILQGIFREDVSSPWEEHEYKIGLETHFLQINISELDIHMKCLNIPQLRHTTFGWIASMFTKKSKVIFFLGYYT